MPAAHQVSLRGELVWCVNVPASVTGKRFRIFRDSKEKAEGAARAKIEERQKFGMEASEITLEERALVIRWRGKLTVEQINTAAAQAYTATGDSLSISELCDRFEKMPRERKISDAYKTAVKVRLKKFRVCFPRNLLAVTAGDIRDFLAEQGPSGQDYYATLRAMYRYATMKEWLAANPFDRIGKPDASPAPKDVFTPEEMKRLLRASSGLDGGKKRPLVLRTLVLSGFCGLRHAEVVRLNSRHIDLAAGEIHVEGMKTQHKGMRERFAQVEPMALEWLRHLEIHKGRVITINDHNFRIQRTDVATWAKTDWLHNGLRRSFGSYHLAAFENAGRTAEIMGHTDAETTKAKYRVPRQRSVADTWFALSPKVVLAGSSA